MNPTATHILVIDGDADTRAELRGILEADGYRVETADTTAEALARTDLPAISVIMLDWKSPGDEGVTTLQRLRQLAPDAAVIVSTSVIGHEGVLAALRHGAADYVLKPVGVETLRASLARIAEQGRPALGKKRSEAALRNLVEATGSMIVILRPDHTIAYFSPFAEQLTGYAAEDVLGRDYFQVFLPEAEREGVDEEIRSLLAGPPTRGYENPVLCRDGSRRWMVWNAQRLDDYEGEPAVLAVGQDITERRQAELALRDRESRLRAILNTVPDAIITIDESGTIESLNPAAERLFGYSPDEAIGRNISLFIPSPGRAGRDDHPASGAAGGDRTIIGVEREVTGLRKDGTTFLVEFSVSEVQLGDRRLFSAIMRDITGRKQTEDRLLQSERLAAIGKALTGLAHESRNALQRSQAGLEMLARRVGDRPEALRLTNRIQVAQDDLNRLYEEVRAYAAPIRVNAQPCDLSELLREAWDHLALRRGGRTVRLQEQTAGLDLCCEVDRFVIRQAFRNILDNSLAACGDPVEIDVAYGAVDDGHRPAVRVAIRDNGPGLTPDARERIFEEFYTTKTHGTGLGMAIVRRFVSAHFGTVEVGPGNGGGTEILITLPRKHA